MIVRRSNQRFRTCLVLLTSCVLSLVSGCKDGAEPRVDPPPINSERAADPALPKPQRLLDSGLGGLPRLRIRLPRSVPAGTDGLPSLLTDPPGRALVVYHPPEVIGSFTAQGWASETLLVFGSDRRWRRLRMDELGPARRGVAWQ